MSLLGCNFFLGKCVNASIIGAYIINMREILFKWIKLDAQTIIPEVWYVVGVLWLCVVIIGLISIKSQAMASSVKLRWSALIVLVPFIGMLAYCVYCLTKVDYHMLEFLMVKKKGKRGNLSRQSL